MFYKGLSPVLLCNHRLSLISLTRARTCLLCFGLALLDFHVPADLADVGGCTYQSLFTESLGFVHGFLPVGNMHVSPAESKAHTGGHGVASGKLVIGMEGKQGCVEDFSNRTFVVAAGWCLRRNVCVCEERGGFQ